MALDQLKPDLVIFDCDGVLIDSEVISATVLMKLLEAQGLSVDLSHVQRHFLGRSFPTVAEDIRTRFNLDLPASFEADYRRILLHRFEEELQPSAGVTAVLDRLRTPYCVATSSSPERVQRSLVIAGLDRYFAGHVYTASQVDRGKPAPDLFLYVATREGFEPGGCLVIEDSVPGIEAARAAGMPVLHFTGGSHFEGIRSGLEVASDADAVFDSWDRFYEMVPSLKEPASMGRLRGQQI